MAEEAHTSGAVPRWRARLVLSSTDANEAAVRLCLVRWEKGQPRRAKGPRQTTAASTEHPGVASAGLAEGAKAAAVGVPVVLVIGPGLAHGSSWMLRGLPVAGVRLEVISDASACSSATLRTALEAHAHGSIACALYEPVCSQTGRVLRPAQAEALREVSSELGFPLIADETRCGLGRCGDMLTSPRLGLAASLYTLGEALGGGYASVAAVLYDPSRFNGPFPSTATMANDNLGSHMGLAVLGSLVRSLPSIRAAGLSFEASVREALSPLADERCGVCDVAGRGLLLCVSFRQRAREGLAAAAADSAARRGWPPSLILHSYLLETHGVRARPSGAAGAAALVVEPPAVASDASGRRVCVALRSLAEMLDAGRYAEVCAEAKARRRGPM